MKEELRILPVQEFEDYWVSNYGQVYSMKYGNCRELTLWDGSERMRICLDKKSPKGKRIRKCFPVHRLVMFAFGSPQPENKRLVRHWDGNYKNNHISNLLWGDDQENADDRKRHLQEEDQSWI